MNIQPASLIPIAVDDDRQIILGKAANVIPSPRQLAWQRQELIAFVHFGVNTFSDMEWGTGLEDPRLFKPSALDARQWASVLHEAGFRQVILTAKHHDGFCLWPSRYTDFSVKHSPWRGGNGDVLRELSAAAREFNLKLGVYLSPADLHEMEAPGGRYGNNSPAVKTTIPTPIPGDDRHPEAVYTFNVNDYNRYYLNQLYELLTEYGPIHEVWFDGANPKPGVQESYNYDDWFSLVRALAPEAVIFNGPDVRWVGNELGWGRETEWSPLPFHGDPASGMRSFDPLADDLGSREKLAAGGNYLAWHPAEVDVSIRPGWFYHASEDEKVKSLEHLMMIYYASVGRNGVLLLNIPPDQRGRFADGDVARLKEFGATIRRTFARDLARQAEVTASSASSNDDAVPELTLDFGEPQSINYIVLQEDLCVGQRVERFCVQAEIDGVWQAIAEATTIGYKRILPVERITTRRVRLRILQSRLSPAIAAFSLF